jgi:streptolysin S family bacteriocin protoxin
MTTIILINNEERNTKNRGGERLVSSSCCCCCSVTAFSMAKAGMVASGSVNDDNDNMNKYNEEVARP